MRPRAKQEFACLLSGAGVLHRQRRDDRVGRRDAAGAQPARGRNRDYAFNVRPRWPLDEIEAVV